MNLSLLEGRLGADPQVRFTQSGQPVCNFSLATSQRWTDKAGEKQEKTEWHRITVWGRLAETCGQYLKKGRRVFVQGRIEYSQYTDKEGQTRYSTNIVANDVQFLDSAKSADVGVADQTAIPIPTEEEMNSQQLGGGAPPSDDIPF